MLRTLSKFAILGREGISMIWLAIPRVFPTSDGAHLASASDNYHQDMECGGRHSSENTERAHKMTTILY
ncbi:hypothetical protein AX14_002470 [Amanita brunnescens Koide BX004]|nr:hypothetical protein AX14_002470 [Amanita brunnescens Koide BX004]